MKQTNWILASLLGLAGAIGGPDKIVLMAQTSMPVPQHHADNGARALDAREKRALHIFLKSVQTEIVAAAEDMPAVKYSFAPTEGEFKGVRTFGQQLKHLAATNHILAAAALGEETPAGAGDEMGPETVRTKAEILDYRNASFEHLARAIEATGDKNPKVKSSPIA